MYVKAEIFKLACIMLCTITGMAITGCAKKVTRIPQPLSQPAQQSQSNVPMPDTESVISFNAAQLDSMLNAHVRDSLRTIHFDFNKSDLKSDAVDLLGLAGRFLLNHPSMRILIAGNCDERGTVEYNIGLGQQRAQTAKQFLVSFGAIAAQIEITSYGKERLSNNGCATEECHAQNRRDDFTVLDIGNRQKPVSMGSR